MLAGRRSRLAFGLTAFAASAAIGSAGRAAGADTPSLDPQPGSVVIQLLGVNDFHGHLESPDGERGGAAWLGAHLDRAEARHPGRTIRVHAGDMVGASPLVSSWFHDEPSMKAAHLMRFDVGTLGNHEFDEGGAELLRLLGGGHREDGLQFRRTPGDARVDTSDPAFAGAGYPTIAANTTDASGRPVLPPFAIVERGGVRVGFIGVTTTTTPDFLLARHAAEFRFLDASDSVNRWVPELRRRGVETIVVLAHSGNGEILSEAAAMDDAVDVVVAGHTHSRLNERVGSKLVVQAWSYGVAFDRVELRVNRATGDVTQARAEIEGTPHAGTDQDPAIGALVAEHVERAAPVAKRVVGTAPRTYGHPAVHSLAAEAQRGLARADAAIVHRSTVRAVIEAGELTYEELFRVGAYEHDVLAFDLPAADAAATLEEARRRGYAIAGRPGTRLAMSELVRDLLGLRGGRPVGTEVDALVRHAEANWR